MSDPIIRQHSYSNSCSKRPNIIGKILVDSEKCCIFAARYKQEINEEKTFDGLRHRHHQWNGSSAFNGTSEVCR